MLVSVYTITRWLFLKNTLAVVINITGNLSVAFHGTKINFKNLASGPSATKYLQLQ